MRESCIKKNGWNFPQRVIHITLLAPPMAPSIFYIKWGKNTKEMAKFFTKILFGTLYRIRCIFFFILFQLIIYVSRIKSNMDHKCGHIMSGHIDQIGRNRIGWPNVATIMVF